MRIRNCHGLRLLAVLLMSIQLTTAQPLLAQSRTSNAFASTQSLPDSSNEDILAATNPRKHSVAVPRGILIPSDGKILSQGSNTMAPSSNSLVPSSNLGSPSDNIFSGPGGRSLSTAEVDTSLLDATHDQNNTLSMEKLRLHSPLRTESFKQIRLEVAYDESINLEEALRYAVDNNLAIKISKDNLNYQRYLLYGSMANALPNVSTAYNLTHTDIANEQVKSLAKVFLTRVTYPVFQGGSVVYSILGQLCREKGWKEAYKASVSDALLDLYQRYNTLLLNRVLLQIRGKAVEVSDEQLRINKLYEKTGTGTVLAVLQADAQLSADKQALLQQEVLVRQSALALNFSMNYPMSANLVPSEESITEHPLFENDATIETLIDLALRNRPELREYEQLKIAAARNVQVAVAPLYPTASFFQQYSWTDTTSSSSAAGGTAGAGVFGGLFETYQQGFALVWSFNNMGLTSAANIFAASSLARQSGIQANQNLQAVIQQVRFDYLNWRAAREQIDNSAHGVRASEEELRLAKLRLGVQIATELDVIQAQSHYITSLTTQAQAIVGSNLAQAQLMHDIGIINTETLLHGYKGPNLK